MNEIQIESFLRRAPSPAPPASLRQALLADIHPPNVERPSTVPVSVVPIWRRWIPALSFGLLFLGCLMVLGVQTFRVLDLRRERSGSHAAGAKLEELRRENLELQRLRSAVQDNERLRRETEEQIKLRAEVAELRSLAQEITTLRAENQRLRNEHDAMLAQAGVAPADDPFTKAKEKAEATGCINNLKQIGLAGRIWANEHKTTLLPVDWLTMKSELNTPKILTCPGDTIRTKAGSWDQFDGSSVSYELPSAAPDERDPYTVYSRCSVHGFVGLTDGSVQSGIKPDRLQQVDGNLKLRNNAKIGR
jgi:hypothetical protein